jgi:hypothetical protein
MANKLLKPGKMCFQPLVEYERQDDRHKGPGQCRRGMGGRQGKQQKGGCGTGYYI